MNLTGRNVVLVLVAVALAALFVRLGFWQLSRRAERAAVNETRAERADAPELDWTAGHVPRDTTGVVWRRVSVRGRYDREREIVLRGRTFEGRPGVEVLTPLDVGDAAVLVIRGWLPASDALRADLSTAWPAGWADTTTVRVSGVAVPPATGRAGQPLTVESGGREHLALAGADVELIAERLPYPVLPYVIRLDPGSEGAAALRQPAEAEPGMGNHLSYAIQWFAFAVISVVGTAILLRKG